MPIPEPAIYRPSNLTKEQRQEQLAALYGVTMAPELSHEEIERMRQIVQQHDSQRKPFQVFDLNNPPKQPYHFQKFPMMVYDLARSAPGHIVSSIVHSEGELDSALRAGLSQQAPEFGDSSEGELSPAYADEARQLDGRLEDARRGPGRPSRAKVA